jgi:hypothetical protein
MVIKIKQNKNGSYVVLPKKEKIESLKIKQNKDGSYTVHPDTQRVIDDLKNSSLSISSIEVKKERKIRKLLSDKFLEMKNVIYVEVLPEGYNIKFKTKNDALYFATTTHKLCGVYLENDYLINRDLSLIEIKVPAGLENEPVFGVKSNIKL